MMGGVHHQTAVKRLRTLAEGCDRINRFPVDEPVLMAAYAYGAVVEQASDLDFVRVALVLDVPVENLTWGTRPQEYAQWFEHQLQLDRTPVAYMFRPSAWPVWNHRIERPLRFWSIDGVDHDALDALAAGNADQYRSPAPSAAELASQLAIELDASRAHLRRVREGYWERQWRSENKGYGRYPENHLWDAVDGYLDLLDAVEQAA